MEVFITSKTALFFCGKDRSPACKGVPERSAGMKANAGRADSLVLAVCCRQTDK